MNGIAMIDGSVVDVHEAKIPLNERGYLLGDGIFETLRVSNGRPFALGLHRERLVAGLSVLGLEPEAAQEFDHTVDVLLAEGRRRLGEDLYLRVQISTGPMDDVLESGRGILVTGIAKPFRPYPLEYLHKGVDLVYSRIRKQRDDPLAVVKTLSFLPYITARREAHSQAVHDALILNDAGRVAEVTTSNVFAVIDGVVHAPGPEEAALPGTMRRVVLDLLAEEDQEVRGTLTPEGLAGAEEAWLTNTTGGVVPVRSVAGTPMGVPKGPLATRLQHSVEDLVRGA